MAKTRLNLILLGVLLSTAFLPAQRHRKLAEDEKRATKQTEQNSSPPISGTNYTDSHPAPGQPENNGENDGANRVYQVKVVDKNWHFWLPILINSLIALGGVVTVQRFGTKRGPTGRLLRQR
jgi:hypothetical protein